MLKATTALGFSAPTLIQSMVIPVALQGKDVCASARTGSGKTAAFALPFLERLLFRPRRVAVTRVLVLTPTRELAVQAHSMIEKLAQFTDIRAYIVIGGVKNALQVSLCACACVWQAHKHTRVPLVREKRTHTHIHEYTHTHRSKNCARSQTSSWQRPGA